MSNKIITNKPKIIEILFNILERPGLYYVSKIEDIKFIVLGFGLAVTDQTSNDFLSEFRTFANKKFESAIDADVYRLIRFYSAGDSHSIELFRLTLEEFLSGSTSPAGE